MADVMSARARAAVRPAGSLVPPAMSDPRDLHPSVGEERRAELRVPASTLGDVRSRLVGGSEFALLNYTPRSLYGQSRSRLLVGTRISVRLATTTLNAIVHARVVRSSLTAVRDGVPCYEVALALEEAVDWSRDAASAEPSALEAVPVPVPVRAPAE
jgi:hypothetical protein